MQDREANVEQDAMCGLVQQETLKHLQAVGVDIELMEVVEARISGDFELLVGCVDCEKMGYRGCIKGGHCSQDRLEAGLRPSSRFGCSQ